MSERSGSGTREEISFMSRFGARSTMVELDANPKPPAFFAAIEHGEITHQDGWHNPGGRRFSVGRHPGCGCDYQTEKGAYRDVTVEIDDKTIHYYHQSPVVTEYAHGIVRLDSCGWRTRSTKQRINRYMPRGYRLIQRDFDWYVTTPDGLEMKFEDGMFLVP